MTCRRTDTQDGLEGHCGGYVSDDDFVVALPTLDFEDRKYLGKTVEVTRVDTGKTIAARVFNSCPPWACNQVRCLLPARLS